MVLSQSYLLFKEIIKPDILRCVLRLCLLLDCNALNSLSLFKKHKNRQVAKVLNTTIGLIIQLFFIDSQRYYDRIDFCQKATFRQISSGNECASRLGKNTPVMYFEGTNNKLYQTFDAKKNLLQSKEDNALETRMTKTSIMMATQIAGFQLKSLQVKSGRRYGQNPDCERYKSINV